MIKKIIFTIIILAIFINAKTQVVTSLPLYPIPNQLVTIYFDASLGNAALANYTSDIWAHTGVITNLSTSTSDWKHVKTNWGINTDATKLTRISTNKYSLQINPSIIDYYGLATNETVLKLAFVFRNSDGSKVAKNADGSDIFVDVYANANQLSISSPDTTKIYSLNDNIDIKAVSLFATQMTMYLNGTQISTVSTNEIQSTQTLTLAGTNQIKIVATDGTTTIEKTTNIFVRHQTETQELPSANLIEGINYINNNTVTLVLYAPYKDFVFVNGSFNNWNLSPENQMYRTADGTKYWLTISNLEAGQEYSYQYIIDGKITIADPYADKLLDPWNDLYISSITYPNLIPYPTGKATGIVSVFQTAQTNYNWQITNFQKPNRTKLVIYELHIRDFIAKHDYKTLCDTLNYLKKLGINAIELMPINEFEGNNSWGYNPDFYFAVDKYYGTKNDLKQFIDKCHANGIAVLMDLVLNHSFGQSPLVQMYYDQSTGHTSAQNPWYNAISPNTSYSWGFDFNHESIQTKKFVSRVVKYWIEEYKFDGYRFDFTKGFTNTTGDGWAYDASRIKILENIVDTIWKADPNAFVILEHLTDNSEEKVLANYGFMLWGNLNNSYNEATMGYADSDSDFSWISYKNRGWNYPSVVGYMESHDEERIMFKNLKYGNTNSDYNIKDSLTALKRMELAAAFFFTIPGPKMIWQFGELGYDYSINNCENGTISNDCRTSPKPIRWDYLKYENRQRLYSVFSEIIKLKTNYDAFSSEAFSLYTTSAVKHIVIEHSTMNVVIIGNFDVKTQNATPKFNKPTTWYDYFSGRSLTNTDSVFILQPGEYHIFTTVKLENTNINTFPEATNVSINGDTIVGKVLTGVYNYFDINNDLEGNSTFKWYRADDKNGLNKTEITGENTKQYTLTAADMYKYISFEVTPLSLSQTFKTGATVSSKYSGLILGNKTQIGPVPAINEITFYNIEKYNKVTIIDVFGKIVASYDLNNQTNLVVNLTNYRSGVYMVKLSNSKDFVLKKFMIVK